MIHNSSGKDTTFSFQSSKIAEKFAIVSANPPKSHGVKHAVKRSGTLL